MIPESVQLWILSLALLCASSAVPANLPSSQVGRQTKSDKPTRDPEVIDLRGYRDILQQHRGKPLMVNFWATWCEPCRDEYPMIVELAREYAPQGLVVVGVSLDEDAEINLVRHFLARNKPIFTNYRKRPGNEEAFINGVHPRWTGALPATFFYARDGRLITNLVGEHKREEFAKAIQALLALPPGRTGAAEAKPGTWAR